jgi:carbohydrate diacid regulator
VGAIHAVGKDADNYAMLLPVYIESAIERESELSKTEYLKRVLLGECSSLGSYKYAEKFSISGIACFAIVLRIPTMMQEALEIIQQYDGNSLDMAVAIDEKTCVLIRFVAEVDDEDASSMTYAEVLAQSLTEELAVNVKIGIGPIVRDVKEIAQSYARAENALRYADIFSIQGDVHSYRSFALLKILEDVPGVKLESYAAEFIDDGFKEIFQDEEMLETAEEFLRNSLNVSETSRNLYLHRNTLLYRLDKIEKTTGLNIRSFSDALSFYVLTAIYRLLGK